MLRNPVKLEHNLALWLWEKPQILDEQWRFDEILKVISNTLERTEKQLADAGSLPSGLPARSRNVYCWLQFLASPVNLKSHLQALATARNLLQEEWQSHLQLPFKLEMLNRSSFYRYRIFRTSQKLVISEGMINADKAVWQAVFSNLFKGKSLENDHVIKEFMASSAFREVMLALESQIQPDSSESVGKVYCLQDSFERVNQQYFDGALESPRLVWGRDLTYHKFGHYHAARDTVLLSRTLDQKHVPEYLVDFVMYHELLHKIIDTEVHAGRRRVHSAEFRRREKQFVQYDEAQKALAALAAKSRR